MKTTNNRFSRTLLLGASVLVMGKLMDTAYIKYKARLLRIEREESLRDIVIYANQMISKLEEKGELIDSYKVELFYHLKKAVEIQDIDTIDWTLNIIVNDDDIKKYE